ncbi:hypothetical protein CGH53_24265, partial [Vibrio parahaemolyticus]
ATFAWILSMYALFTVSVVALVVSAILYLKDRFYQNKKTPTEKSA